ncbi:hypothetical protein ABID21_001121 [Pseudorhizobium tarimense]|uniref:Uncharacterized protein n=1 Tax=Pseudorhizobium tarimense TaxID=1079109 RepID=A0ABV2H3A2_9HYPH|nr:hypothetical protein [Pseudorhizobium tarimense]MCJ8518001.1 hypothetical protein [Pseudorhizobium tarimense]
MSTGAARDMSTALETAMDTVPDTEMGTDLDMGVAPDLDMVTADGSDAALTWYIRSFAGQKARPFSLNTDIRINTKTAE